MARDEKALKAVAEQAAAVMTAAGMPKMPARVMMALLVSEDGALTAHELSVWLSASAAAISGAVRYLKTVGIVRRIAQPGSRRDRYELPDDTWYAIVHQATPIYTMLANLGDTAVAAIDDPGSGAVTRLNEMAQFYRFIGARMPVLMAEWEQMRIGSLGE